MATKKAAPKKKAAAKTKAKAAPKAKAKVAAAPKRKMTAINEKMTKTQILNEIATNTNTSRTQCESGLGGMEVLIERHRGGERLGGRGGGWG